MRNVSINISYENKKIKFNTADGRLALGTRTTNVLLFYYKNKIYNNSLKYKYKFIDLVINKFNLFNINLNIHIQDTFHDNKVYNDILSNDEPYGMSLGNIILRSTRENPAQFINIREYYDPINAENIEDVKKFISEDNENILIVSPNKKYILCISKSNLDKLISDYNNYWYYDCKQTEPDSTGKTSEEYLLYPYIKLDLNIAYYIPYAEIFSLLKSSNKVFFINTSAYGKIEKTRTYKSTRAGNREYRGNEQSIVSAWHCQEGTSINISHITTINTTNSKKNKISLDKSYLMLSSSISSSSY